MLRFRGFPSHHVEGITNLKREEPTPIDFNDTENINEWEMRDGPFTLLSILNVPWIDYRYKVAPLVEINDGLNDIIIMGNVGRCQLIKQLLNMNTGDYF